ncbi:MAG: isoprenylcysteine carboxylmethyltransferase family protein [Gemmatimonadaceae bacterium]
MTDTTKRDNPGVRFPPPLLFVGGLLIAWLLETRVHALPLFALGAITPAAESAGYTMVIGGFAIAAWGMITFARARTAIIPHNPASSLVESGPYRFTRNPMYTGMTVAYLGGVLLLNTWWAVIFLPVALLLLFRFVVKREERYLAAEFGTAYEDYRKRVKRWI